MNLRQDPSQVYLDALSKTKLRQEPLPFSIGVAASPLEVRQAVAVRAEAYARHDYFSDYNQVLQSISDDDLRGVLLVAKSKESRDVVGTMRLGFNELACSWLPSGLDVTELQGDSFVYCDRFGAHPDSTNALTIAFMKAVWFMCVESGVRWIVGAGLKPLAKKYALMGLEPMRCGPFKIPYLHTDDYFPVAGKVEGILNRVRPVFQPFFRDIDHPDIWIPRPKSLSL